MYRMIDTQKLTLYYFNGCPYCAKVINFLKKNNITIPMKNIHEEVGAQEELIRIGGKSQVPCLVIDGQALYESDDIIEWLTL
jgi:glutaredoxin